MAWYFEVSFLKVWETIFEEEKSKKGDIFEVNHENMVLISRPDIIDSKITVLIEAVISQVNYSLWKYADEAG